MDNLCHTLVGAALAEAGLKRRTRYGMATLLIGANLPDLDVMSFAFGGALTALDFRRGWTHGVLGLVVLPAVLTGLVLLWNRAFGSRTAVDDRPPLRVREVALLATISILTHPILDFMNTYGMRWLMPFVDRWYYGDALYIVDPWIWAALGTGIVLSRTVRRRPERSEGEEGKGKREYASYALLITGLYAAVMLVASLLERSLVAREVVASGSLPLRVMVAPVPVNPLRRTVVIDEGDRYRLGTIDWLRRPALVLDSREIRKHAELEPAQQAAETEQGRVFLHWARFPFFLVEPSGSVVHIVDARYTLDPDASFGAVTIVLPRR
jgi:inner membrane protein